MRRYCLLVAVLLQLCALVLPAVPAQAAPTHIAAQLVPDAPGAPGGTITLAIHMKPGSGWHGYWLNPGDAGLGMTLDWDLPPGAKAGIPRYPVPHTLLIAGLMNHVFKSDYAVLVPLTLPRNVRPGARLPISVKAQWLACTDKVCVPEQAQLATEISVIDHAPASPRPDSRFDDWTRKLPAPLGSQAHFAVEGNTLRLAIPLPAAVMLDQPHFFAAEDRAIDYAAPQVFHRKGDTVIVELRRARVAPVTPAALNGVLRLGSQADGLEIAAVPGPVPAGGDPVGAAGTAVADLPLLLLAALAGGLLLNIMPCVFPILSLKALSLARAGESEAQARAEGLAYTGGVVLACLGLGAVLLALRAGGEDIGWAFQLQEPAVVVALLLLAVAITVNLLGWFEFSVPGFAQHGSSKGAFATGLLAAFVATPCTGPFMAAAMGAALLLPVPQAMALFAALGVGIALPFLAIAFVPALRRRLPRPGHWMVRFRRWMAIPMGLTALALLWLGSRIGGMMFTLAVGVLAALLVLALYRVGHLQRAGKAAFRPALAATVAALAAIVPLASLAEAPQGAAASSILPARPFSAAALAGARASGKPVFVWFTADWCLTCKVNEQVAIEREATRAAFARAGVSALRGDWTRRDPEITRFLTARGAAGVPLYLWYPAGGGEPVQLPQILGPDSLTALVEAEAAKR